MGAGRAAIRAAAQEEVQTVGFTVLFSPSGTAAAVTLVRRFVFAMAPPSRRYRPAARFTLLLSPASLDRPTPVARPPPRHRPPASRRPPERRPGSFPPHLHAAFSA